jgi:hypothetical protein|tara:strand:+ start:515 stop:658 length:144 start_codon:yes stop_codon:yes gene_type:complete
MPVVKVDDYKLLQDVVAFLFSYFNFALPSQMIKAPTHFFNLKELSSF